MKLYKHKTGFIILEDEEQYYRIPGTDWDSLVNQDHLYHILKERVARKDIIVLDGVDAENLIENELQAPIGQQEVWAAGVTYWRSREARIEESKDAGGGSFYDKVYIAERPELFFKATAGRTVGSGGLVNIRKDSTWDVPEPELTLFINSAGKIQGYTIGNDMSSRSIEGENPLYLPQAKTYDRCAGLGPCLYVPETPISPDTRIALEIKRKGESIFKDSVKISQMKRRHEELVAFLFRECSFTYGCYLMTGTGIVPPHPFTLTQADEIRISIDSIGTLVNIVS